MKVEVIWRLKNKNKLTVNVVNRGFGKQRSDNTIRLILAQPS